MGNEPLPSAPKSRIATEKQRSLERSSPHNISLPCTMNLQNEELDQNNSPAFSTASSSTMTAMIQQSLDERAVPSQPEDGETKDNLDPSHPSILIARQEMRDRLYKLLQDRCSVDDPKAESQALEELLFRSLNGNMGNYRKMMCGDKEAIAAKLKDVGTQLLLRRLQKKRLGGFRSKMILTKLPVLTSGRSMTVKERLRHACEEMDISNGDDKNDDSQESKKDTGSETADQQDDRTETVKTSEESDHQLAGIESLKISEPGSNEDSMDCEEQEEQSSEKTKGV